MILVVVVFPISLFIVTIYSYSLRIPRTLSEGHHAFYNIMTSIFANVGQTGRARLARRVDIAAARDISPATAREPSARARDRDRDPFKGRTSSGALVRGIAGSGERAQNLGANLV